MVVDLGKGDLVNLVCGVTPNYSLFENPTVKKCGSYYGSYDKWSWSINKLSTLSEEKLYDLYRLCLNSWK